ncbi:hypothetical protein HELRODRAFT_182090 [Helobdella robusta]|uniref:Endonuclease/exonuclease/phosphatase domain-containing protein n=1 Tax=Helobdella robusta TaxID=6412 RepID=T1FHQ3_HELRO|nr:hypothetical protein HELRODRAFT_182090 [Helobdella robusta]ESN91234.1 hypothetical protein HELRODRAFT_182090 [Helobdella robusta]
MSEAHVVLMGDFNIHVEKRDSSFTLRLHEILDTFQLVNHVNQKTHVSGGTLDLVICSHDFPILDTKIDPCSIYSDHSYVGVRVALNKVRPKLVKACIGPWKDLNEKCFVEALANSPVANKCQSDDVDYEFAVFSGEIERISDNLVPMRILQFFYDKIARITETTNVHSEFPLQVVSMLDKCTFLCFPLVTEITDKIKDHFKNLHNRGSLQKSTQYNNNTSIHMEYIGSNRQN